MIRHDDVGPVVLKIQCWLGGWGIRRCREVSVMQLLWWASSESVRMHMQAAPPGGALPSGR